MYLHLISLSATAYENFIHGVSFGIHVLIITCTGQSIYGGTDHSAPDSQDHVNTWACRFRLGMCRARRNTQTYDLKTPASIADRELRTTFLTDPHKPISEIHMYEDGVSRAA